MAKWSDFETHPVGTSDRIKELEQLVASLEAQLAEVEVVLQGIVDLGGTMGSALYAETVDRAARIAIAEMKGQDDE